ncbi:phage tail-collar fiber domain-containing protein [Pseudomonas aeruginosa]
MARITAAGERLIAQKLGEKKILEVSRFVLALVPGLDPTRPVDRDVALPPAQQIVHTAPVTQAGYVNPNQVVYSLMMGSDVGDFDWNWIGLETAEKVLLAVAYVPVQQKRRNRPPLQIGNNVTRNFLVAFDGAQELTGITIDASTWQHDFTVRLAGIDERERLANRDMFGRASFFSTGLLLEKASTNHRLKAGLAYVEGIRVHAPADVNIAAPALPNTAWLDVRLQRNQSDVVASWSIAWGANQADYTDSAGVRHYLVPLANLDAGGNLVADRRLPKPITGPLVDHWAAQVGDYPKLRARATTKADVQLDKIPNAISDDPTLDRGDVLATTKATRAVQLRAAQDLDDLAKSLGTAAKRNVGTAAGNVMEVGAFGLGNAAVSISGKAASDIAVTGWYMGSGITDAPTTTWWFIEHIRHNDLYARQNWYSFYEHKTLTRHRSSGAWSPFVELYHTGNLNPQAIVPAGAVMAFAMIGPPAGYLKANGAAISRTTYAALFAVLGTYYGAGDGSTTFNLPDYRGEFLRGLDDGRGVDPGRVLGTNQASQNLSHVHGASTAAAGNHTHSVSGTAAAAGAHSHSIPSVNATALVSGPRLSTLIGSNTAHATDVAGAHTHSVSGTAAAAGSHSHAVTIAANGGSEARPRNVSVLICIKY